MDYNEFLEKAPENEQKELVKAFIKALDNKDYNAVKGLNRAKFWVNIGCELHSKKIYRYGFNRVLKVLEQTDYCYWEIRKIKDYLLI